MTPPRSATHHDRVAAVRALARGSRLLERVGGDLNLAHYRVLAAVASGEERASRVASRLALGKPTISAAVDSLCQRGLLVRGGVAGDQRAAALSLTAAGQAMLVQVEANMTALIDELCARTDDPDAVIAALVKLGDAIEQLHVERKTAQDTSGR